MNTHDEVERIEREEGELLDGFCFCERGVVRQPCLTKTQGKMRTYG